MPLSLHYYRVDVAALPVPCISDSDAARVPLFTFSTQYLLVPVFQLSVSCYSHFELSVSSYHNEILIDASQRGLQF